MTITISPYRVQWPAEFQEIGRALRSVVGEGARAIHHIGSTSVPGLDAKDIIDVQLTVADLNQDLLPLLHPLGFTFRPDITRDHQPWGVEVAAGELQKQYFRKERVHLHVRREGAFNQGELVVWLLRDFGERRESPRLTT